jgi:hypothetical protein
MAALISSRDEGGKSELHRAVCRITSGRGWPILNFMCAVKFRVGAFSTESATENIPPRPFWQEHRLNALAGMGGVRVKRRGKSAPPLQ